MDDKEKEAFLDRIDEARAEGKEYALWRDEGYRQGYEAGARAVAEEIKNKLPVLGTTSSRMNEIVDDTLAEVLGGKDA